MNKTTLVFLIVTLFFFSFTQIKAQRIREEKQSLITVLKQLETQYNVRFSYADANLKNKTIIKPSKDLSLDELLKYLEDNTSLIFKRLNDNSIVIRNLPQKKSFKTQYLEEILITNYLTKGISKKNDGSLNVKPQQFGILPGLIEPDVLQTIQALPGVQSVDERVSNINVRGGTHDQNLILWDGIKMYQSGHFFGLISAFNPYLTENVVVSKNGTSAMYGDGVSSIIDMQSSNTIDKEFSGGAGLNMINIDAYVKIPLGKKTELQLSARRSVTDLIVTPTYDQYFKRIFQDTDITNNPGDNNSISKNERFYFYDVSAKLLYSITKKDKLRFNFLNIYNKIDYEEQSRINDVNERLNSNLTQRNLATGIEYLREWNSNFLTTAQVYLSNYDLDATNFDVLNNQRLIQENEVYDGGLKLHFKYNFNDNLSTFGGYQFTEVGISNLEDVNNPVFRRFIKEVIRTHSVFNELKYSSKSNNTNAKIGVRANYIEKFSKTLIEPRLSFSQRFLEYFRLEILGELKSQTTSQIIDLQNDFLGVEKRRWILSNNEDIPIIKSKQISTGIHFNKNKLIISAEAYIKEVDGITTRSQGFQNQYQFENKVGSYCIKGVDFSINKQFSNISIWLSYSYSKNDYTFKELNFGEPFPNNFNIEHALTFAGTYTFNAFKFAAGINWRTGKPFTKPDAQTPIINNLINYNSPNSSNLDDYLRADLSGTYTFQIGDASDAILGFSLWNVLDKSNIVNTYYSIDDNDTVTKIENQSLGITPNVSFRVRF
ncbi:MAG: TonB-dependent receptor plug domain-containing protein [Flavobacteriaceae bacterium]|nr:TonB-dependent receptor plug domain-containing protein [Flavobacteriaceae bacterium]